MFIILLEFSKNKTMAKELMPAHNEWLQTGFNRNLFVLSGSLKNRQGGGIVATSTSLDEVLSYVNKDPFVINDVVKADVIELDVSRTDKRFDFLSS